LQAHLDRLYKPAKELKLKPSTDEITLRKQIAKLTKEYLPNESRLRLILTKDKGSLYIAIQKFERLPDSIYQNGVHVITSEMTRSDPRIKDTAFILKSAEERKSVSKDVFEILLTKDGKIYEGMTSNFYTVFDSSLITAQRGILLGVTRKAILKLAKEQGMNIIYRSPTLAEKFNEAFLTSSSRGVVPIVSMDGKPIGQGRVGAWTKRLSQAYQEYVKQRSEEINPH
jgi:branched-chain amino acid aminotransferase